jgi:hypothetical protein
VSEAPAELWVRPFRTVRDPDGPVRPGQGWYQTLLHDESDAVRYVRADMYEAAIALNERVERAYAALLASALGSRWQLGGRLPAITRLITCNAVSGDT